MSDLLVSAAAPEDGITIAAVITTELVREIQARHDSWPTATAAIGRLATGAVLFAAGLEPGERIALRIVGDGPLGPVGADAWMLDDGALGARGYARNPHVDLPLDARGKFDVAGAVGAGSLQVTKSYADGQPYVGIVPLHSGEIAEDLATYLGKSEQIPSVVALGVLANPAGVIAAGGIIAQILPGADERSIARLEERALAMPPVTTMIAQGAGARELLLALAGDSALRSQREVAVRFACLCTRTKVEAAMIGLGPSELRAMAAEREDTEASCEYCRKRYEFSSTEIEALATRLEAG
jgi:molecular chaperone Hsp33